MPADEKNKKEEAKVKAESSRTPSADEDEREEDENEGAESSADPESLPAGLSGEDELDEIYSQRGGSPDEGEGEEAEAEAGEAQQPAAAPSRLRIDTSGRRRRYGDAREVLLGEVPQRAERANERLRGQLKGTISVEVRDTDECYLFDWKSDKPVSREMKKGESPTDCTIKMSQGDLLRIASGDLNPQVGMLSDKINVEGNLGLAVYFFNLVAPAGRS